MLGVLTVIGGALNIPELFGGNASSSTGSNP